MGSRYTENMYEHRLPHYMRQQGVKEPEHIAQHRQAQYGEEENKEESMGSDHLRPGFDSKHKGRSPGDKLEREEPSMGQSPRSSAHKGHGNLLRVVDNGEHELGGNSFSSKNVNSFAEDYSDPDQPTVEPSRMIDLWKKLQDLLFN